MSKDLDKIPIVGGAYITVVGKLKDIIKFVKLATQPDKKPRVTFYAAGKTVKYYEIKPKGKTEGK